MVVLLFYAFSIVVLMVKYIRRENKEAYLRQYFDEFVAREQFQSARARNQISMKNIMDRKAKVDIRSQLKLDLKNPAAAAENRLADEPPPLNIPETISELVDGKDREEEEEMGRDAELAEGELCEELAQIADDVQIECEQLASLEELLPGRETPV